MSRDRLVGALLALALAPFGCTNGVDSGVDRSGVTANAGTSGKSGGCGGEAAAGGYLKYGSSWDGSAGNAYGYPADQQGEDCAGFGFHDGCSFWESCSYACQADEDCPVVEGGSAPECRENDETHDKTCVLPCANDLQCPDGMSCISDPYGWGTLCLWKRTFG